MMNSIRWRLVLGMMALTLLAVSVVGVVALLIMQRYMVQQERAYLTANAEAIAKQAIPFMRPIQVPLPLQQLAQTAAFFGDVSVRIVDNTQFPLADSTSMVPVPITEGSGYGMPVYFGVAASPATKVSSPDMVWALTSQQFTMQAPAVNEVADSDVSGNAAFANAVPLPGKGQSIGQNIHIDTKTTLTPTVGTTSSNSYLYKDNLYKDIVKEEQQNVILVQRSPSIWGDRLTFDTGQAAVAAPVTNDEIYAVSADFAEYSMSTGAQAMSSGPPPPLESVMVEAPMAVEEVANGQVVQPTLLQVAGLQSTDYVTVPIQLGNNVVGFVELGRATDLMNEPLSAIRRALAIAAGASALLAIGVGLVLSRTLTAPIQKLAQTAAIMSDGDLTARAPVMGRDELASLAHQFNQMADALHASFAELEAERDTLRRFVADASHELRTPITALRTFNELLQGPAQDDHSAQAEFLAESHCQIARLEWITGNLLDLSRWDGGMATLTLAEVEVGEMVASAAAPFRALAHDRQIDLCVTTPNVPLLATLDEQRMGMAVGNLLDNAIKFTPCAGKVVVGVDQDSTGVKIWVEDNGMGICQEELPHIFERFYRSPRATQGGSGLGLAIVERIVKAHGATIDVQSREGEGSRFTLSMTT